MFFEKFSSKAAPPVLSACRPRTAVVLLHGFLGHSRTWFSVASRLQKQFPDCDLYAVDFRNHGRSPHKDAHSIHDLRSDLRLFLQSTVLPGGGDVVLVGHSMGSLAACSLLLHAARDDAADAITGSTGCVGVGGRVKGLISIDMPPLFVEDAPRALVELLETCCAAMRRVRLERITDLRTASAELAAAGCPQDQQLKNFLLTNLIIDRQRPASGAATQGTATACRTARWRCNVNVLAASVRDIFLSSRCVPCGLGGDRDLLSTGDTSSLHLIDVPVLAIMGRQSPLLMHGDAVGPSSNYRARWDAVLRDPKLCAWMEVDGAGHNVHYDALDDFSAAANKFIGELLPRR